jgi:opacity protein-like surface antigen
MKNLLSPFAALAACLSVLLGCSMSADTAAAEQAVPKFHALLDERRFDEIYEASSDELKKASTRENFVALLQAVNRKLGSTKSSEKQGWKVNYHTSGTFVFLNYKTMYTEGEAAEQFVYKMKDGTATLAGYHINSNALILK